eukprot:g1621.t1
MGPDPTLTLNKALDRDIGAYVQKISEISESAAKEQLGEKHLQSYMCFVDWVQKWPGQVVIGIFNLFWTAEVNQALTEHGNAGLVEYATKLDNTLTEIVNLVRREIPKLVRCTLEALIVIFVHNKDTIVELRDRGTCEVSDFDWLVQLRYFIEENPEKPGQEDIFVRITNSHLGDLAALARFCVVFNCSDELDVNAMARASWSGAFLLFSSDGKRRRGAERRC